MKPHAKFNIESMKFACDPTNSMMNLYISYIQINKRIKLTN
jgi:hypothetical protein